MPQLLCRRASIDSTPELLFCRNCIGLPVVFWAQRKVLVITCKALSVLGLGYLKDRLALALHISARASLDSTWWEHSPLHGGSTAVELPP